MLTPKQQRFVAEYLKDLNATQAAIRTGYSAKTAGAQGSRLLTNAEIRAAVAEKQQKHLTSNELSAARVLEELRRLAFSDLRGVFDEAGNVLPVTNWTADQAAALAGFEVVVKNAKAGDGVTDTIHKFKTWDKTKALDILAKHFGLLKENVEHHGEINIRWAD